MAVRKVVANIAAQRVAAAKAFCSEVLDMRHAMDFGSIVTFATEPSAAPQISIAREVSAGTSIPQALGRG